MTTSKENNTIPLQWNASEQRQKANPSVRAGVIPLLWRGDREVGVVSMKKRSAFTLAEVLITLGIIGVVSAMTIPNLVSNYQYKALDTKKTLFQERLYEAMNQMRFHEKLTGYSDAEDFVAELGKYLKINETCDLSDMTDCFPSTVINSCDEDIDVDDLETGEDFAADILNRDFKSNNVGVVFADGTNAIVNYDLDCEWLDPYESGLNRTEATQCVSIIADVNGRKGKNTVGSDIVTVNTDLGIDIDGICWDFSNTTFSAINTCDSTGENSQYDSTGSSNTYCANNMWAGAKKACDLKEKDLPSRTDVYGLANYLYNSADDSEEVHYYKYIQENFDELNFTSIPTTLWVDYNASYNTDSDGYAMIFNENSYSSVGSSYLKNSSTPVVRCTH
ncbi:MAG: type II secretion system protein [Candidatus Gastranaerophilales bacterium]